MIAASLNLHFSCQKCTTTNDYFNCPNKDKVVPLYDNSRYECSRDAGYDSQVTQSDHQLCEVCAKTHDQCPICESDVIDGEPEPRPIYVKI